MKEPKRIESTALEISVGSISLTTSATAKTEKSFEVRDLLDGYDQCAFAIGLHNYPRTRYGQSRIRAYETYDTSAFVLVKKSPQENPLQEQISPVHDGLRSV